MSNSVYRVPTNVTFYGGEGVVPRTEVNVVGLIVASVAVFGLCLSCLMIIFFSRDCFENRALREAEEHVVSQEEHKRELKRKRKEYISNSLNVKEWVSDDPPVKSTEGDQDTSPSGEAVEVPQEPQAPTPDSSPASCVMGSDDCESLAGEEDMAGCAICLSHFKPRQLVCESTNSSCQHVFHKDCMVDWLMLKHQDTCPMCREVYLLITV
jgi:hypothetical protein